MKKRKRLLLIALMTVLAVTVYAQQYDPESDFEVERWGDETVAITKYVGSRQTVRIPPRIQGLPVTYIGGAFRENKSITSVRMPNRVTVIGSWAFANCTDLASVTIPNSVTRIWGGAFSGCESLTSITIPKSVTRIDDGAFGGCIDLASVTFQGTIASRYFFSAFPSDLRAKFYATDKGNGTPGTYTRDTNFYEWIKQ